MAWALTGRDAELRRVEAALATGGIVIAGAAGVGKTRLAAEAAARAEARGARVAWVRASQAAAAVPLGAFAPLLPGGRAEGAELLAHARQALADAAGGRSLVLCVDDGQLLDPASAALLHQVVAGREAIAIVTVRRGDPVPDALRALWKDELCERLDLSELGRGHMRTLLGAVLGGPLDARSETAVWELTRGNALYLRELVRHGRERALLAEEAGAWRWRGELGVGARLTELVEARIADLSAPARRLLELAAVAAPLELGLLAPGEREALAQLEARELVARRAEGRRRIADVAHPMHAEGVREQLPPSRLEALQARLANAVEAHGARRRDDRLRVAVWRLDVGGGGPTMFTAAAEQALAAGDPALAERLARAGGTRLVLGRALAAAGRAEEAERVLGELVARATTDDELVAAALAASRNLFWGLDRAADADALLRAAEARVRAPEALAAQRVRLAAAAGRPHEALAGATPLLTVDGASVRVTAALGAIEALFSSGRTADAVALVEETLPIAERERDALPHAEPVLLGMRAMALRFAGRLTDATAHSEHAHARLVRRRSATALAVESAALGLTWLARGRVRAALRLCRESASLLRDGDPVGMLAFALSGVAQAAAQAGDAEGAATAIAELERTPLAHSAFAVEVGLGRAWAAAAAGELTRAAVLARAAADHAETRGQFAYAVRALHELARLGDPAEAAPRLAALAGRAASLPARPQSSRPGAPPPARAVDGRFAPLAADHAAALVTGDGAALLDAAERLAAVDALLAAAEAAHAAAAAHREAGRQASARGAAARASLWLASCEGARTPALLGAPDAAGLTRREREIALLAAGGASSREIAERLVLSVRTVDNHLASAYRKLGVARRQDLPAALEPLR